MAEDVASTVDSTSSNNATVGFSTFESSIESQVKEVKSISLDDVKITPLTVEISVAPHGSKGEWLKCKVYKIVGGKDGDVAVLQLEIEILPGSVKNIVDLNTAVTDESKIKPGTDAILIGYPMGVTLANTERELKVQVYEGQINKESGGVSIQYNITSTHVASGSPIFNECGQLIAVNYSGYDEVQG